MQLARLSGSKLSLRWKQFINRERFEGFPMRPKKLITALAVSLVTLNSLFISNANAADQIIPDYSETFVPEIKYVKAWLTGHEKSMTFHLKLETKVKKNSLWRVVAHVNAIPKTERVSCQIPSGIEERGIGGTPETGHAQPILNEKRSNIDSQYSLVSYEFQTTSRVTGNGFPFCMSDYYLAYLAVYSTSGSSDSYSLPYDTESKKMLPLINLASTWANWYPDKLVPPCQEPVRSNNYGVAWKTACQLKFDWPNQVFIESTKSAEDLAMEQAEKTIKDLRENFETEKSKFHSKLQTYIANRQTPNSYRTIFEGWIRDTNSIQVNDLMTLRNSLQLLRTWEIKADSLMSRVVPSSITCVKGKVTKIIKGTGKKCPPGFKRK